MLLLRLTEDKVINLEFLRNFSFTDGWGVDIWMHAGGEDGGINYEVREWEMTTEAKEFFSSGYRKFTVTKAPK